MSLDDARKQLADALAILAALQAQANDAGFSDATDRARQEALDAARAYVHAQKD